MFHDGSTGVSLRNGYAHLYQQATAAAIPSELRPMPFFCRSGSLGSQAFPCHWVGDTPATWQDMAGALRATLSLSLSGFPLVAHDAGGFHSPGTGWIPAALLDGEPAAFTAEVDPELYGRWGQWAAFSPVTRFHGLGLREPTAYPPPWSTAVIRALQTRRRLLPLLRSALTTARASGLPIMRPPELTHPGVVAPDQYLLGDHVLVAPLLEPGGRRRVWFPPGSWTSLLGSPVSAGHTGWQDVSCDPLSFPTYIRQ